MRSALVRRQVALAAVAVLALALALAVGRAGNDDAAAEPAAAEPAGDWYTALAAPYAFERGAKRTACGIAIGPRTMGVSHPVLPCGAKLVLEYGDTRALTQVIDRGPEVPGRQFDISRPLAQRLQLSGIQQIRWQFAR